jgi:hypothetical protein
MTLKGKVEVCKQKALDTLKERFSESKPPVEYEVVGVRRRLRKIVSYEFKESIEVSVITRVGEQATLRQMLYDEKTLRHTNETPTKLADDINKKPHYP